MSSHRAIVKTGLSAELALFALLLFGCTPQQTYLQQHFPHDLANEAQSNFQTDMTDWDIADSQPIPKHFRLTVHAEPGVTSAMRNFCERKLTESLTAAGFELDPNEPAELTVCVVKASQIRKPIRSAKVRIAAGLRITDNTEPILLGLADGIVPRPDLSSGVSIPRSAYFRAAQLAISKLVHQLTNMRKTAFSEP